MAIISSVAITAAIATGEFQPADIWRQVSLHPTTELASWLSRPAQLNSEQATPRLIVQSSRVSSGEPMPLGVGLRGRAEGAVVIIKGLFPGWICQLVMRLAPTLGSCSRPILAMLGSLHRRVLSGQLISLPNCVCPMKRWINK